MHLSSAVYYSKETKKKSKEYVATVCCKHITTIFLFSVLNSSHCCKTRILQPFDYRFVCEWLCKRKETTHPPRQAPLQCTVNLAVVY